MWWIVSKGRVSVLERVFGPKPQYQMSTFRPDLNGKSCYDPCKVVFDHVFGTKTQSQISTPPPPPDLNGEGNYDTCKVTVYAILRRRFKDNV